MWSVDKARAPVKTKARGDGIIDYYVTPTGHDPVKKEDVDGYIKKLEWKSWTKFDIQKMQKESLACDIHYFKLDDFTMYMSFIQER